MWAKGKEFLSIDGLVLPVAGAVKKAWQVASLSAFKSRKTENPHIVATHSRKFGTEVKCNCFVYRSSYNLCQHALVAVEDINIFLDYIEWIRMSQLVANLAVVYAYVCMHVMIIN